ncbi:MAG: hypothetical protein E6713_03660 [Sporomusaceae bacterium]|nr:hypothetical protein [Sporomusaceae bacterium]
MAQLAAILQSDSNATAKHLLEELDSLEDRTCSHCTHCTSCNIECGDIRIFENMRKEILELTSHSY